MQIQKCRAISVLSYSVLMLIFSAAPQLQSQQPASAGTSNKPEVYVVPFSHLDLFWAGTREETVARGNRIIAKAISLSKAQPQFRFLVESDNFVENFVDSHKGSAELNDLKRLVKEGRIAIAPNWANIFHNMPDGEVHVRNLLYGKRYARTVFDVEPRVMHPADIPGFTPQFPQILQRAGIPFMVMTRMGPPDQPLFDWKSPDGSKVLVWNEPHGYGWGVHLGFHTDMTAQQREVLEKELREVRANTPGPIFVPWGVDLWSPNEKIAENVEALNRDFAYAHFTLATPQDFFAALDKSQDPPELSGEIPVGWPHVVDGILHLWQLAVPATNTLETAESFATVNYALGYADYPQQEFEGLWKNLIESMDHNHDGQGGEIGDRRKQEYSESAIIMGGQILRDMLRNIAERVQIPVAKSLPIVVFNGLGWQRDDFVRAHVTLYGDVSPAAIADYRKAMRLVDETGKSVPFQVEYTSENISRALELIFVAQNVPSFGYKTYFLTAAEQPESFPPTSQVQLDRDKDLTEPRRSLGSDVLENQFYRVTVDKATGRVTVFDKQLNKEVCKDMEIAAREERGTNNVQREIMTGRTIPRTITETSVEENNPVRTVFKVSGWIADIPIVQRLILYKGLKRLDLENSLDWKEQRLVNIEQLLPLSQPNAELYYGVPFGANSRQNMLPGSGPHAGDEIQKEAWETYRTIQDWVFAGTSDWGITLAADHQLVKLEDGLIRGNMIRGQRYTSVKVVRGDEVTSIHFPAPGHYVFRYSLSSAHGDWKAARSYRTGRDFNNSLIPVSVVDDISAKSLPPAHSFVSLKADNLILSALKKSEHDGSIILRLYEIEGAEAETPLTFNGKPQVFRETDLLEQDLRPQEQHTLHVKPYEIKTVRLQSASTQNAPTPRRGKGL